jgi:anti-sigma factor RsiW
MNGSSLRTDPMLRRYLLGQLSDQEQSGIEERFFTDDSYFQQVELAVDDLIEFYLRGELSSLDRQRFEKHFLSTPERRRQLQLNRTLRGVFGRSANSSHKRNPWLVLPARPVTAWLAAAASLVFALLATGYLGFRLAQHRTMAVDQLQQWEQQLAARDTRISQLESQLRERQASAPEGKPKLAPGLLSFILTPNLVTRGQTAKTNTLIVASPLMPVQLHLDLELDPDQSYESYRAILETPEGGQVWARDGLRSIRRGASRTVVLTLPSGLLQPAQYRAKLFGQKSTDIVEEIHEYAFRVVRR